MNKIEAYKNLKKILNDRKEKTSSIIDLWTSLLFLGGRYQSGLEFLEKRRKKIPIIDYYCWKGIYNYFLKNFHVSVKAFEKIESLSRKNFYIKYFIAESYFQLLEISKAEAKYRAILAEPTLRGQGLYGIACCMAKKQLYTEALGFLNWALKIVDNESKVKILNQKGLCLLELGKNKDSMKCFEEALRICPQDYSVMTNLALVLSKSGQYDRAVVLYEKILNKFPYDLTAINNMALCKAALEDYTQALEYCDRGLKIDAMNKELLINKGYCLYKLKNYKKALECLCEAEKNAPDDKVLLNNKALCYMALEKYDEALKIWQVVKLIDQT